MAVRGKSRGVRSGKRAGEASFTLRVKEVYPAVLGESWYAGSPCLIVRLAGCNLRCSYCDTAYAYTGGRLMGRDALGRTVKRHGIKKVLLTGGEPLLQPDAPRFIACLIKEGYQPIVETNGSLDVSAVPYSAHLVMDLKSPGSGCVKDNRIRNLEGLKPTDEIKMVLTSRPDYLWARRMISRHRLDARFRVTLSPAHGRLDPADLARWMIKDRLDLRLGLQLHKYIFGEGKRRI